jgi:hypothetical protein
MKCLGSCAKQKYVLDLRVPFFMPVLDVLLRILFTSHWQKHTAYKIDKSHVRFLKNKDVALNVF